MSTINHDILRLTQGALQEGSQPRRSQRGQPPPQSQPQQSQSGQQPPQPRSYNKNANVVPKNAFEAYLTTVNWKTDGLFYTDEQIDKWLYVSDKPLEVREKARKRYHDKVDRGMKRTGGRVLPFGFKPNPGEQIHLVAIPDTNVSIRMWDGGLAGDGLFLLDFVEHTDEGIQAVNSLGKYKLYPSARPGAPS